MAPAGLIAERYRLLRPLGSGSSATVWAAADETLGRQVALKLLSSATADDEDEREQLRHEARALAALTHPHIIVVFDFLEAPGFDGVVQPVLVTELLEGRSLAARLADRPMQWQEALAVCGQLADALAAAHQAGIVHRDVTPNNVMLTGSGVKLLDFGLAETIAAAGEADGDGLVVGTPVCMAPEQLRGEGALPASDVYAFGCVLYWCLTGRPPYRDKDMVWLSQAHLHAEPPPLTVNGLPEVINELYLACLAKEPDERPMAEEAVATLAAYVPVSGTRSGAGARSVDVDVVGAEGGAAVAAGGASAAADGVPLDEDATQFLPMIVAGEAGAYGSAASGAVPPAAAGRHAGQGRAFDRRKWVPVGALLAALAVIALLMVGLTQTMSGGGGSANQTAGGATASGAPPAGSSATATTGAVILPMGSAPASTTASASPSSSASMSASPSAVALAALANPGADPVGYVQGLGNQVRALTAQGPAVLQAGAGQSLLGSLGVLQNDVASAVQHPGSKQQRAVADDIAAVQRQISADASAGRISGSAANLLSGELRSLSGSGGSNGY